jgi:type I restriction enzyme S subunit
VTEEQNELYEIPKSWSWSKLQVISDMITDGSHAPPPKQELGIPMLSAQNIFNDKILFSDVRYISQSAFHKEYQRVPVKQNDVLLTIVGTIGRSAVVKPNTPMFTLQRSVALIKTKINPNYLSFFFQSPVLVSYIKKKARGTAQKGIYLNQLKEIPVAVAPFNEQGRIVGKVEALFSFLDAGTQSLRKVQAQLKRYRQAILKYAFEGKLTEEWRKTSKNLVAPVQTKSGDTNASYNEDQTLPKLPEDWRWVSFCDIVGSYQNGLSKRRSAEGEAVRVLRLADIENGKIVSRTPREIKLTICEMRKFSLSQNDLLCIRVNGSKNNTGRLIVFSEKDRWAFCDHLIRMRLINRVHSQYVKNYFDTQFARKLVESRIISSAGQNTISQTSLDKIPLPLAPIEEQIVATDKIEYYFSIIEYNEKVAKNAISQAERLRQSILKRAFAGELVNQDSNDEPVEKLLERVRAERINNRQPKRNSQLELSTYVK